MVHLVGQLLSSGNDAMSIYYALLSRIRLSTSEPVLQEAAKIMRTIMSSRRTGIETLTRRYAVCRWGAVRHWLAV